MHSADERHDVQLGRSCSLREKDQHKVDWWSEKHGQAWTRYQPLPVQAWDSGFYCFHGRFHGWWVRHTCSICHTAT